MSVEVARFGTRTCALTHLIPDVCGCHVLRISAVAVCRIGDICCLPAPAHQPFSFNSLGLSAPEEACSRNVRALGTLKFGFEGIFRITEIILQSFSEIQMDIDEQSTEMSAFKV